MNIEKYNLNDISLSMWNLLDFKEEIKSMSKEKINFTITRLTETFDFIQFDNAVFPDGSVTRNKYEEERKQLNELYTLLTYPNSNERTEEKKKSSNYKECVYLGEFIQLFLNGCKNSKGLNHSKIEISENGCRDFINRGGNWYELLKFCNQNNIVNFNPIRINFSININAAYIKDKLTSLFNNTTTILYFGNKSSLIYISMHSINFDQVKVVEGIPIIDEEYYRIEISLRHEMASWFIREFLVTEKTKDYNFIIDSLFKQIYILNKIYY